MKTTFKDFLQENNQESRFSIEHILKTYWDEQLRHGSSYFDLYPNYSKELYDTEDEDFLFETKEKAFQFAEQIQGLFDSFPKKFAIYRAVWLKDLSYLDKETMGESWSFDLQSAKEFGSHNSSNYILAGFINNDDVDWDESLNRYCVFSSGEDVDDENEIVVPDTSKVEDLQIFKFKEAKEIAKNPIFTRVPSNQK